MSRSAVLAGLCLLSAGCVLAAPRKHAATSAPIASATPSTPAPVPSCADAPAAAGYVGEVPLDTSPFPPPNDPANNELATPKPTPPATPATPAPTMTTDTTNGAAPALVYAALDAPSCVAQLKKRGIPYANAGETKGVDYAVRLTGKLHGVEVHGLEPPAKRPTSQWEILDCRLVLALDDFTKQLAAHDVVEAVHMSVYRPPSKNTKQTKFSRHEAALAIDLGYMVKKDGTKLSVLDHWHGHIGAKTCGAGAGPNPATKEALEIRSILCDAAEAKLFNVVLTPDYNKPHQNHFHLEVTRGVKWFIVN